MNIRTKEQLEEKSMPKMLFHFNPKLLSTLVGIYLIVTGLINLGILKF